MELIDSPQNQYVKLFRVLETGKGRRELGLFAVEGVHSIEDLLRAHWPVEVGYWCPELLADETLPTTLRANSKRFAMLSRRAFEALSDVQAPQGIAAAVRVPRQDLQTIPGNDGVILAVHRLRDPGNMGNMIRTADAAGALGVLAVGECVDFFMPKVVRAAAGSLFHLPLVRVGEEKLLEWARQTDRQIVATAVRNGPLCHETHLPARTIIVIGNEAQGLPERLLTASDIQVTIPMPGAAESLNAAVAAGILLYEFNRQRC